MVLSLQGEEEQTQLSLALLSFQQEVGQKLPLVLLSQTISFIQLSLIQLPIYYFFTQQEVE